MMRRRFAIVLGAFIVLTAIAVGAMTRSTPPSPELPGVAVAPTVAPTPPAAPQVETDPAVLGVIERAMKDLDLIRPSRAKVADDFTVKTLDGGIFRLSEQRGKVVLVNFWATWCPPCLEEMPAMQRLHHERATGGFVLLAVSVDADARMVRPFVKEHAFTFVVGLDSRMELANAYGVRALPASFLVDRAGHLAALALGPRQWDSTAARALVSGLSR
jgi:peroxiredoxin